MDLQNSTEIIVEVTDGALNYYHDLLADDPSKVGQPMRLYLDGKGCDGFYYGLCFDKKENKDHVIVVDNLNLVVDSETLKYVKGSKIDFIDDDRGRGFLVENPNQKNFRGKFFKRKNWEHLTN